MSEFFKVSVLGAAVNAVQELVGRRETETETALEGVRHRVSVLRVKEGRIIEQSARLNGC